MSEPASEPRALSHRAVVDAALRLVEEQGFAALSMRRLAAELGVAVTAIYWHVGNRQVLLDELLDRLLVEMDAIRPAGTGAQARLASIARSLRRTLLDRPHLVGLAHAQGRMAEMFHPAQAALARELAAAGVGGEAAAHAVQVIQFHVIGSVILERTASRGPAASEAGDEVWRDDGDLDPVVVARLAEPPDHDRVFELGLRSLVRATVPR